MFDYLYTSELSQFESVSKDRYKIDCCQGFCFVNKHLETIRAPLSSKHHCFFEKHLIQLAFSHLRNTELFTGKAQSGRKF